MGNEASVLNITEEQVEQLIGETKLDKGTLMSLADIFAAPPAPVLPKHHSEGRKSSIFGGTTKSPSKKSHLGKLTLRRKGSSAPALPEAQPGGGSGEDQEMPLPQFAKLLEDANIAQGEAAMRMAVLFDTDHSGTISLKEFVTSMSVLLKGEPEQKLAFIFQTYDIDGSGTLTVSEVELLAAQMMSAYHLKGVSTAGIEADQVVMTFLRTLDSNGDGVITEDEFVTEGVKNPKLLPLLVNHNWELGEDFMRQRAEKFLQAARQGKLDRVKLLLKEVPVNVLGDSGETALFMAARKHPAVVKVLLEAGADPNLSNFLGVTPMHRAALSGQIEIIEMLAAEGALVDATNLDGYTPFHTAVMEGNLDMLKALLKLKADYGLLTRSGLSAVHIAAASDQGGVIPFLVSEFECSLDKDAAATFEKGFTPLHFACQDCNLSAITSLLTCNCNVDVQDDDGFTPLSVLARRTGTDRFPQLEECIKLLLAKHANPRLSTEQGGNCALHVAAISNNVIMCHLLGRMDRDLLQMKNKDGKTPLQVAQRDAQNVLLKDHMSVLPDHTRMLLDACRHNDLSKIRDMAQRGGDPNAEDGAGNTALYFCILNKSVEGAVILLSAGASVKGQKDRDSPLHAAILTGVVPLVTALLDRNADAKHPDPKWGMQAIHAAAFFGKPLVIRVLVGRKVSGVNDVSNENGKRPVHWAAQRGQVECMEVLLDLGADIEALTDDGLTPLHLAAAHGRVALIDVLLKAGANVDAVAPDGRTVLHFAVQEGDGTTIGMIMKASAGSILAKTVGHDTVLHRLCMGGTTDAILQFQKYGEQLMTSVNTFLQTPLHLACRFASVQFVETLLLLHPTLDLNMVDKDGFTPIYYAAMAHKEDIIVLLKSKGASFYEERVVSEDIKFEQSPGFPKLESATIEKLIDYLILTCDKIDDVSFRDTFFLAYRQLIKPSELLDALLVRFEDASADDNLKASGFVPSMRSSQQVPLSVTGISSVDKNPTKRRGSVTGKKKKVGLKSSTKTQPVELTEKQYLIIRENRLRQVTVLRLIRRWVQHSFMDFDSVHAMGANKRQNVKKLSRNSLKATFSSSKSLVRDASFMMPRAPPILRGTSPDANLTRLVQFLESLHGSPDEELNAELAALEKAIDDGGSSHPSKGVEVGGGRRKTSGKGEPSFLDWSPEVTAQQLAIISKRLWDSLSLWEFYDCAFTKKEKDELCPNINALIRHINRVGDWAKSIILSLDDAKKRGACITHLIQVLDHCVKYRDFSDAMGLSTALQSTSLERLKKSWKYVPEETVEVLTEIKKTMDPRQNYKNLRAKMEERANEPTVCFIGLSMGDIIHCDEVSKKIEHRHNWYKYELLGRMLSVVPKYQKIEYSFTEVKAFASMFNSQDFLDAEQVRARSKELEPPE
jgi:ankyrin repeat protein/Ca2+-binding EF-hand superfamily protein